MQRIAEPNSTRGFVVDHFGDQKLDKRVELNESMSISGRGADQYEQQLHNVSRGTLSTSENGEVTN